MSSLVCSVEYEELFTQLFTLSTVEEVHGMMAAFRDASWPASSFEQQAMPIRRLPARRMFQSVTLPANQIDQGPRFDVDRGDFHPAFAN